MKSAFAQKVLDTGQTHAHNPKTMYQLVNRVNQSTGALKQACLAVFDVYAAIAEVLARVSTVLCYLLPIAAP